MNDTMITATAVICSMMPLADNGSVFDPMTPKSASSMAASIITSAARTNIQSILFIAHPTSIGIF